MEDPIEELLAVFTTATWKECSEKCRDNEKCSYWKWHNQGLANKKFAKQCILMKITGAEPYAYNENIIAGTRNCTSMYRY